MLLFVIFLLLAKYSEERDVKNDTKIFIDNETLSINNEIQVEKLELSITSDGNPDTHKCHTSGNCSYTFNIGKPINIICTRRNGGPLGWTDDYEFWSGQIDVRENRAFTLRITPDETDVNLNLTCATTLYTSPKITVHLTVTDETKMKTKPNTIFLEYGKNWTSKSCYGIVYYPTSFEPKHKQHLFKISNTNGYRWTASDNHQVITNFDENQEGTKFYCISYTRLENIISERSKLGYIFYLKDSKTRYQNKMASGVNSITLGQDSVKEIGSQSNTAVIVGGVISAVIILLGVLGGLWYKTVRRRTTDNHDTQVIYAEIEVEPSASSSDPPPRSPVSYAKIIGFLATKQQENQNHYVNCTRNAPGKRTPPSENLYCNTSFGLNSC